MKDENDDVAVASTRAYRNDLAQRSKHFALDVVRLYVSLPKSIEVQILGKQCLRSATSVGAHYREAKRARSDAEFISKIEVALQELEETQYWFELLQELNAADTPRVLALHAEAEELIRIFVTVVKHVKHKN